jgi:hypothetical protein
LTDKPCRPPTAPGDVIIHHEAPRVYVVARVVHPGDLVGNHEPIPNRSREAAVTAGRKLLAAGRRIYIHHRDDAEWEQVS